MAAGVPDVTADGRAAPQDSPPVRVLVVDDQLPFRAVARTVVKITPGFQMVGEAESGEDALAKVAELDPDLVLMDINMPGITGIEATARITDEHPRTKVILLSTYKVSDLPTNALDCAIGYIHKEDFDPDVLEQVWSSRPT